LKKDRDNGIFGSAAIALGSANRFTNNISLNKLNGAQQITLTGKYNNINSNNEANIANGLGAIIANNNRNTGYNDGIATSKSINFNYTDNWSKKIRVSSSYYFSNNRSQLSSETFQQNFEKNTDSAITNNQNTSSKSASFNHGFSARFSYKIDSMNWLEFTPKITYNKIDEDYNTGFKYFNKNTSPIFSGSNYNQHISTVPNYSGNIYWGHSFRKRERYLSINIDGSNVNTNAIDDLINNSISYDANNNPISFFSTQRINQNNANYKFDASTVFSEPISSKVSLSLSYSYSKGFVGNNKQAFDKTTSNEILIDSLSNNFENIFISNRFGLSIKITQKKYNYTVGIDVQPASIETNIYTTAKINFKQDFVNYFPVAAFTYKFSKSKSIYINYIGKNNQPTYYQTQPAPDFSNVQNIIFGNPQLRPAFNNSINLKLSNYIAKTGDVYYAMAVYSFVKDKIINDIVRKKDGTQETRFLNADGYYNFSVDYGYTKKIKGYINTIKYGGRVSNSNDIVFFNNEKISNSIFSFSQSISATAKIKKWVEANGNISYRVSSSSNTANALLNNSWQTWSFAVNSRLFLNHNFTIQYSINKLIVNGFINNNAASPLLVNASIEKQFLRNKKASISFQVNDLLNQNTSIGRNVNTLSNAIVESSTNQLQRYFLVSVGYRFSKFKETK
jgi:hypothetical protein